MRVWVEISPSGDAGSYDVDVHLGSGEAPLHRHPMARLDGSPWVAPVGFEGPAAEAGLAAAARSVAKGDKEKGLVTKLGRHLFESLLGKVAWEQVKQAARAQGTRDVELAISWPLGETQLHAPIWEAMYDGSEFLAAHPELTVAITRVLPTQGDDDETPVPSIPAPARVLFAIGAETRDPKIRAGVEVLGLLRGAERGAAGIDAQILESTNVERLGRACALFKPDIVHFISHGRISESQKGQLRLRGERLDEEDWVGADGLLTALRSGDGHSPTVVVLTGCLSAAAGRHVDPLAAELVKRGIPVVLGMSGRISDRVCRLFVRRFGVALSQGAPLVDALTSGRRAGLQQQDAAPGDDPAWALPSIYLGTNVEAGHSLVDVGEPSPVVALVKEYEFDLEPVFCGRLEHVEEFDKLLDKDEELNNLVVHTGRRDEKLGKTRLLHEFAARAVRRGHLVVWIDDRGEDISRLPRSYALLATDMLGAILEARKRFDLGVPGDSSLVREISWASESRLELDLVGADSRSSKRSRLGAFVHECREESEAIAGGRIAGVLQEALADDLTQLAAEARRAQPSTFGPDQRVVAVLGGIGKWGEVTDLLCQTLLGTYGLGTATEPVPVFATASIADAPEPLERGLDKAKPSDATRYKELSRFQGEEEILAYQTVLLHPSRFRLGDRPPLSPYVPNCEREEEHWKAALKDWLEGLPDNFRERLLIIAPLLAEAETLLVADEEDVMRSYLEEQGRR